MEKSRFSKILSKPTTLVKYPEPKELLKPTMEETRKTALETQLALEKISQSKIRTYTNTKNVSFTKKDNNIIKYTPYSQISKTASTSQKNEKIVKLIEMPVDPLECVKFRHRKLPFQNMNDQIPILHSPQRKVTFEDQRNWRIPPCVSSSKNPKGLVIPLDIRLFSDGRNLREYKANPNFSKFADVLYIAEKSARSEIEERNRIQESIQMKATLKKKEELKEAAKQARLEKAAMNLGNISNISSVNSSQTIQTADLMNGKLRSNSLEKEKNERNELRNIRKKEIEENRRIEMQLNNQFLNKKRKFDNRDISEKIALGQAQPSMPSVDNRMYQQIGGLDDGFKFDEENDVYDTPLFNEKVNIYKSYNKEDTNSKKIIEKGLIKGKMFEGMNVNNKDSRTGPVQFEKKND